MVVYSFLVIVWDSDASASRSQVESRYKCRVVEERVVER